MTGLYPRFYAVIKRIPKGKVATYGLVAKLAGLPRHARHVGYALAALPDGAKVPWQRVVNAQGAISRRDSPMALEHQRALLERERVLFDERGRIPLKKYLWKGR